MDGNEYLLPAKWKFPGMECLSYKSSFLEYPDWMHYSEPGSSLSSSICFCQGCHGWYFADSIVRQSQGLKRCFMVWPEGKRIETKNQDESWKRSVQRESSASRCAGSWDKCITLGEQERSDPASLRKKCWNIFWHFESSKPRLLHQFNAGRTWARMCLKMLTNRYVHPFCT